MHNQKERLILQIYGSKHDVLKIIFCIALWYSLEKASVARHPNIKHVRLFLKEVRMTSGKKIGRRKICVVVEIVAVKICYLRGSQLLWKQSLPMKSWMHLNIPLINKLETTEDQTLWPQWMRKEDPIIHLTPWPYRMLHNLLLGLPIV